GDSLTAILEASRKVAATIADISAAGGEQANGIDEMSQTVAHLDEMTQSNAALAEESAASANALADRIAQLNGLVAGDRTEAGGTAAAGTAGALQRQVQAAFAGPRSARPSAPSARPAPPLMKKAVNAHASGWDEF
ncbi:hypothetical protein ACFPN9_21485, partial [Bosea massiliensis]